MADLQDELRTTAEVGKLDPSAPPPVPAPESDEQHPDEPPGDDQDAALALALLRDPDADPLDRAHALLTAHPVADGYSGLPWALRHLPWYDLELGESTVDTDVPRMRRGHVGALFWALHLPDGLAGDRAVGATLEQLDLVKTVVRSHPEGLRLSRHRRAGHRRAQLRSGRRRPRARRRGRPRRLDRHPARPALPGAARAHPRRDVMG